MATQNLSKVWGLARHGVWMTLVLALVFLAGHVGWTQDELSPARASAALRQAIDLYKGNEYEKAAQLFAFVQPAVKGLSATEQQDYAKVSASNAIALQGRQDGAAQVKLAEDAIAQKRTDDAANLLKSLNANQYLAAADRNKVGEMNRRMKLQTATPMPTPAGKNDAKSLLTAGRTALQQGDLTSARTFADQAEKASSLMPSWLQPWNDSPAKLRRDIQTAEAKKQPVIEPIAKLPETTVDPSKATSKFSGIWPFGGGTSAPKKDASDKKIDEMMARQVVKDGFIFLQAGDLEKASFLATKAKELNATWAPNEPNPDQLMQAVQQAKGITPDIKDPVTKVEQPSEPMPKTDDPRVLLRHGRTMLEKKKYDDAEKACNLATSANGRWGLFEDNPDKLRKDIKTARQSFERDESVRLLVEARKLLKEGKLEEAEKATYKAQKLHGPYGTFDFGDRPFKLLEDINRAKLARGPVNPNDKMIANDTPTKGIPFDVPLPANSANKTRAITMVREARELERKGLLTDARQKAIEARALRVTFLPEDDSPDAVIASLNAKCDRQINTHLQTAVQHVSDASDAQRYEKAQVQLLMARKLAQSFDLDAGRIEQTAHQIQQVASGAKTIAQVGGLVPPIPVEPSTGDPKKDALRKAARERLAQAQLELSYGKTAQARKMAEELFREEYGIQQDVLKLIRSISAEEYNQRILEAKRNFEAGLEAFLHKDYAKALFLMQAIDSEYLPDVYQARMRDMMATREMQPSFIAQVGGGEKSFLKGDKIAEKRPTEGSVDPGKGSLLDEVQAKSMVQYQMLRQRGQDALRNAHEMFKANQKDDAIATLRQYITVVNESGLEDPKTADLRRLPTARINEYQSEIAGDKLRQVGEAGRFPMKYDEVGRQRKIAEKQKEVAERMKVVTELMNANKLKEADVELRKLREMDPENLAVIAALHIVNNKAAQQSYDGDTHANEDFFLKAGNTAIGPYLDQKTPIRFASEEYRNSRPKYPADGVQRHELRDPKEQKIDYRLRQPISLNFKDVPLQQAIKDLSLLSGIQVQPDMKALQEAKINLDSPLSISVDNIDMKYAVKLLLNPLGLTYTIQNQCLMITTPNETQGRLVRMTYPVADLIVVVPDHPLPDVYNIQKAIERAMQPPMLGGYGGMAPPAYAFSPGETVSSHTPNGLGGAFGAQGSGNSRSSGGVAPSKDRTKEQMAEVLKELIQNTVAKNSWESMGGNGNIQYFPFGMALVISQPQEVQEEVQLLLATLRRLQDLQVSVELRAVLVSESFFERIGVDFDMNISAIKKPGNAALLAGDLQTATSKGAISGLTSAGTLTPDLGFPIRNSTFNFTTPQFGGYQPEAGLSLGLAFLSEIQVFMFLEAVQGDRRAHIMQAPKLTVFNGQQASISGLMIRPTVSQLAPIALGNGQQIMFIPIPNFMPFGLGMTVQPVVSPDRRFVRLNISPFIAQGQNIQDPAGAVVIAVPGAVPFAPFGNGVPQPQLPNGALSVTVQPTQVQLNVFNTTVNVPDGGTVLLGGFKFLAEERTEYGPPVLSKIPYLSRLFRNVGWSRDSSTLIYLVTARIIMVQEEERLFLGEIEPIPGR